MVIGYGISAGEVFTGIVIYFRLMRRRVLLSVSRLISIKGIDLNIRAIKQLTKSMRTFYIW